MLQWILFIIIIYLIYKLIYKPMKYWEELNVPFAKPQPIIGNSAPLMLQKQNWGNWVQSLYNSHENTRYIGIYQFGQPGLLLKDLDLIKQIGIKDFDHFTAKAQLVSEDVEPIFSKNILSLTGHRWKQMRTTLSPTFTGNKMRAMFVLMKDVSEQFMRHMEEKVHASNKNILEVEFKDLFGKFANDVIASTAFGIPCDSIEDESNQFYTLGKKATTFGGLSTLLKVFGYLYFKPLMKFFDIRIFSRVVCDFFKNIVVTNMKEREEKCIVRPDMIHLLMQARKGQLQNEISKSRNDDTGFATAEEIQIGKDDAVQKHELTDDDITAQAFIFFLAGFDAVSTSMSHMAYEIGINPDIQKRLQEEIDDVLRECKGNISYEALMKMEYLDMVFCETLRKWPSPPSIDRMCTNPYTIPAENPNEVPINLKIRSLIFIPIFAIHRDPKYYRNPEKFDPERFNDENKHNIVPNSYLPFGIGPRNCIGSRYAIMEVKIVLFHILSKYNLVRIEKSQVPLKLTKSTFSMNAENGFWLGLELRKNKSD